MSDGRLFDVTVRRMTDEDVDQAISEELRVCSICRVNEKDHATYFSIWNPRHDFEPELTVETCEGFDRLSQ